MNAGTHSNDVEPSLRESGRESNRSFNSGDESESFGQGSVKFRSTINTQGVPEQVHPPVKRHVAFAHWFVDHKVFVVLTTLLTLYALTADDCRLIFTEKRADPYFDIMVFLCIFVFTIEVFLSCLGKAEYFLGFYFWLDVLSTLSLFLDLSVIADFWANAFATGSDDNASNMRSGKTARLGAKMGRILRVLRLVRILKLYKAYYEAESRRKRQIAMSKEEVRKPGEDDEWDEADLQDKEEQYEVGAESQVGKKLSELTIRKTIILILAMLLALPLLKAEAVDQTSSSAQYGADMVWGAFTNYMGSGSSSYPGVDLKALYERAMMGYIYHHNWFARSKPETYCPPYARDGESCPDMFYGHLFWIGVMGRDADAVIQQARIANLSSVPFEQFEAEQVKGFYNRGTIPTEAKAALRRAWDVQCAMPNRHVRGLSVLVETVPGIDTDVLCPADLRIQESVKFSPRLMTDAQFEDWHFAFYFDIRPFIRSEAMYSLLVVAFILCLLVLGSLMFSRDANRLIVQPVEKMIRNVIAIRQNPLIARQMADEEYRQEEIAKARAKRLSKDRVMMVLQDILACSFMNGRRDEQPMETLILEKTIIKLGSLLALGFGEAGANIIRHNMTGANSAMINAMVPGTTVDCIIGVCRVRDFIVATEVLQAKINTFVNMICEIIHGVADEFHGAPNRNNGDTFLVIWRLEPGNRVLARRMAEMSLVAFAKILGCVHRSPVLAGYRTHPGLQYRLGSGCRVNVSLGLHAGWAIEGAVGSEYKIDASYLSPHVNVADSVENATFTYGVSLIAAQSVVELCGHGMAAKCRLIDRVRIKGFREHAMDLYCIDLDTRMIGVDNNKPLAITWGTRNRFKARQFLEHEKDAKLEPVVDVAKAFETEVGIQTMRRRYTVEFFQLFNMGYQNYNQGEWQVARRMLHRTRGLLGIEDGPSSALLRYMESPFQFEAPPFWEGVREL